MLGSPLTITPVSIMPSVPVLRGRENTSLQLDGSVLVLRVREHRIPFAAVAQVRSSAGPSRSC